MSTNTTFGTNNVILPEATNCLAAGENNTIEKGNANITLGTDNIIRDGIAGVCLGSNHLIDVKTTPGSGYNNQCNGFANRILSVNNDPISLANTVRGRANVILDGQVVDVSGVGNRITKGLSSNIEGALNSLVSGDLTHIEGLFNRVEGNPENNIDEDLSQIHVEGFGNKVIFVGDGRYGVHMTGQSGYFLFDENKPKAEDTYNYSNQLAGGTGDTRDNLNLGEGISMIDRTILNGVYPLGKHQSYLNTSDGLSYSIMLESNELLENGTFVTLHQDNCGKCKRCCCDKGSDKRTLVAAKNNDDVIGVITKSSGFIANAGQFAASERIKYDEYHTPDIKLNIATADNLKSENTSKIRIINNESDLEKLEQLDLKEFSTLEESNIKEGELLYPAFLTVPIDNVDRSIPFIPFNERPNYYEVALLGLVIVNANFRKRDRHHLKCDVKNGVAIPGTKYFIVKFIDKDHLQILLK